MLTTMKLVRNVNIQDDLIAECIKPGILMKRSHCTYSATTKILDDNKTHILIVFTDIINQIIGNNPGTISKGLFYPLLL